MTGLRCYWCTAWGEAYDLLTEADHAGELAPEDLEVLAQSAWWVGGRYLLYWAGQIVGGDSEPEPLTFLSDGKRVWRVPGRFTVPAW